VSSTASKFFDLKAIGRAGNLLAEATPLKKPKVRAAADVPALEPWEYLGGGMSKTLAGLLREFNVDIVPVAERHRRAARQTCAGKTLAKVFRERGYEHLRMVIMTFVETNKNNKRALVAPAIRAISDVLNARPDWFGDAWLTAMDGIDLATMFEQASASRSIAAPRSAMATLIFDRVRQHFPEAPTTPKRPKRPADQPATRLAA
jgi:hypothetical protein